MSCGKKAEFDAFTGIGHLPIGTHPQVAHP